MIIIFEHINLSFYFLLSNIVNVFIQILHCTLTIDIETIAIGYAYLFLLSFSFSLSYSTTNIKCNMFIRGRNLTTRLCPN